MDLQLRGGFSGKATGLATHATEVRNSQERERGAVMCVEHVASLVGQIMKNSLT